MSEKSRRFDYVSYDEQSKIKQENFKKAFEHLESLSDTLPESRAKSLFLTALEEAYMWTGKAIRDQQISRGIQINHIPERTNE